MTEQRNIIGESFKPYVRDQISFRQTKLANQNRDEDTLKYITSKTSWVRLSSGVNVTENRAREVQNFTDEPNTILSGNLLAKSNILTNFKNNEVNTTLGLRYAIYPNPLINQGIVPLPGITSVDIKSLNRGSLREATVQIVCHSIAQFKVIEALYLRLKYSMLLEWGHSYWYDSNKTRIVEGKLEANPTYGILRSDMPDWFHKEFLEGKYNQDRILELIEKNRREYSGNYDAFLGYVRNFEWSIRQDGGYNITLNLISIGDVIESLKINVNYPSPGYSKATSKKNPDEKEEEKEELELPSTIANKDKSTLNQILYAIQQESNIRNAPMHGFNDNGLYGLNASGVIAITKARSSYNLQNSNYKDPIESERPNEESNILARNEVTSFIFTNLTPLNEDGKPTNNPFSYIKLGALLRIIESFLLKYDTSKVDENNSYKPIFYIDHDYETNLCLTLPQQFSTDPRICLLRPAPNYYRFSSVRLTGTLLDGFLERVDRGYGGFRPLAPPTPFIGRIMHIPVNIDYIASVLNDNIDEEGKISLYTFLTQLIKGIQTAIGSINNFEVTYDEITNHFVIRDNNIIPGAEKLLERENFISQINVNTLKSTAGSFVKDVSIKSELNNSFASQISIGAQANGNKVGENSTALSKLNDGYTDRILSSKSSYIDVRLTENTSSLGINSQWRQNILTYGAILEKIDNGTVTADDISNATQAVVDLYKYELGEYTQRNNIPGVGFIPINLQINMDGLSGPRIYEVYSINEDLLPDSYKNNIQFITKGVSHKIDNNGWYTTLESFSGPRPQGTSLLPLNLPDISEESFSITTQINVRNKYGEPGEGNLVDWTPPYPMYYQSERRTKTTIGPQTKTLKIHKDVVSLFDKAFKEILAVYGLERINELGLNVHSGTYNLRNKTRGSDKSLHSWGIAIDLLSSENPYSGRTSKTIPPATFSKSEYKDFINIMEKNGLYSLGKAKDFDWMHFQAWPFTTPE